MNQHSKQSLITKLFVIVAGTALVLLASIAYVGFRIAQLSFNYRPISGMSLPYFMIYF